MKGKGQKKTIEVRRRRPSSGSDLSRLKAERVQLQLRLRVRRQVSDAATSVRTVQLSELSVYAPAAGVSLLQQILSEKGENHAEELVHC